MTQFAASTHPGLRRSHNEDCYEADSDRGLWLVADGVGGHSFGEVASAIVSTTVKQEVDSGEGLVEAITRAHQAVLEEIDARGDHSGMGSTVVALSMRGQRYEIAWVGDSRAYLWDGTSLAQITRDHSHVRALAEQGLLAHHEMANHPERHVLTQSIGVSDRMTLRPGHERGLLGARQQILLCSDGLTDELPDAKIAEQMRRHHNPQAQVDALVNAALIAGGHDNITVVVIGDPDRGTDGEVALDLETTQTVGRAAYTQTQGRVNHAGKVWLVLLALVAFALYAWL